MAPSSGQGGDPLATYRARRDAQRTPEPFGRQAGEGRAGGAGLFVIQLHAARRRHYDLRLELGGVLVSWAVPRGPSLDPAEKRLAMHVENHPLDYATFEGIIPEGNYGAGAVVVWDMGAYTPVEDIEAGLESGKLLFDLKGYKLRGRYALVRTGKPQGGVPGRSWLLIKKPDEFADPARELDDTSVLSGLTVEELLQGAERGAAIRAELEQLGAPARPVDARRLAPMLAQTADQPFTDPDWIFELKYDGYRLLAERSGGQVYLRYRSGTEATRVFPEVARAVAALPFELFVLDGEVVVFGEDGRPVFNRLQQRTNLHAADDIRRATVLHPASLVAFDLLAFEGHDLRALPLLVRKRLLARMLPRLGPIRYADHIAGRGEDMFAAVIERGLEGIMAKRADAPYLGQRSDLWLKVRVERVADFVIVGYTTPLGSRAGFGSLHLAVANGRGTWLYAGRVGTGFDADELADLSARLRALRPWVPTFQPPSSPERQDHWVEPTLVCAVKYQDWPAGGLLRSSRFLYLRHDKGPRECLAPERDPAAEARHGDEPPAGELAAPPAEERAVALTNLDKVFWPAAQGRRAYTKGDLIAYYRSIAPWLLPYLRDRPVALIRYPDGIEGDSFFQKDAPEWVPGWIRTETLWSKHAQREVRYFVCDDLDTLLYVVNLGTIPLHIWSSRIATLSRPDWAILDLDPKGAPLAHVIEVARAIRALCRSIELPCGIKTSGQDGLHILIPLGGTCTYEQSRQLAHLLARVVEARLPHLTTTARRLDQRGGRVYLDYVQNAHGRLIAAPLCVRPRLGAPVSMPLRWSEVKPTLDPMRFTMANSARRMSRLTRDPLRDVLDMRADLGRALELLAALVARAG